MKKAQDEKEKLQKKLITRNGTVIIDQDGWETIVSNKKKQHIK